MSVTAKGIRYPDSSSHKRLWEHWKNQSDDVNLNLGLFICTSSTRPGSPWQGQQIYETDTKATGFWDGSAWVISTLPVVTGAPLSGTYTGQPLRQIIKNQNFSSDANGDMVLVAAAEFSGGGVLAAFVASTQTLDINVSGVRLLTGNIVARAWNGATLVTSTSISAFMVATVW